MTTRLIAFRLIAAVVLASCATGLFAGEPKLENPKRVFPTSQPVYKQPNQYPAFSMRLSPDGKRLLYTRSVSGSEQADDRSGRYELVLRELDGGKDAVLPIEPLETGWRTVPTRFNMFDAAGKRLVLPSIKVEVAEHVSANKMVVRWLVYDIAEAKVESTDIECGTGPVKFTADGQALVVTASTGRRELVTRIISLKDLKVEPKPLTAPGWVQSVCPSGDVAVFFVPPARPTAPPAPGERMQTPPMRLVLWDLKADKELALLPTHPRNSVLDDWETQWTADGRYLYYWDVEETVADGQADPTLRDVTRIWDRQAGKPAGEVRDAIPVGPGPGPSLMVLAKRTGNDSGGFLLHDAASGKQYPLGDSSKNLIHAWVGKAVYAEKPAGADAEVVFVTDIVAPKTPQ
jgi:hypothetical protein